jgi:hypothetical protein
VLLSLVAAGLLTCCIWISVPGPFRSLDDDDQITLFSIDGRPKPIRGPGLNGEEFRGYPVLGKIEIRSPNQRLTIIEELMRAYRKRPRQGAMCFNPRHGIRIVRGGTTTEFVICFECSWFDEYTENGHKTKRTISHDAEPFLDRVLTDAGIPLAPK